MTIADLVRRRLSGEHPAAEKPGAGGAGGSAKRGGITRGAGKAAAQLRPSAPRVSLLPAEFESVNRGAITRRRLVLGMVATAVVVALGVGGAAVYAMSEASAVSSATTTNSALSSQLVRYAEVQQLERTQQLATAGARVGSSTAIDWQAVLASLQSAMPSGFSVASVAVDAASPIADYPQGSTPLDSQRVATVTITAKTNSISGLPNWLGQLQTVKGVADATPVVTADGASGYTVAVTVHMTDAAYITPLGK